MRKTTIGVFFGGRSVEHEISVISALQAIAAMDRYKVVPVYLSKSGEWFTGNVLLDSANYKDLDLLEKRATRVFMKPEFGSRNLYTKTLFGVRTVAELDVAFPVFHGTNGEDGSFQGLMELIGIPYVGPGVLSSALGMDKIAMKMTLRECGLPVLDWVWFTDREFSAKRDAIVENIERTIGYPAIVKPANLGSSVGISRALDRGQLVEAVAEASRYSSRILVERMVEPLREINCSVRGSADDCSASVCEEPLRSGEILSYADKYLSGSKDSKMGGKMGGKASAAPKMGGAKVSGGMSSTKRQIPADLPAGLSDEIRRLACETFRVLGCEGIARIDFILDGETVWVNEINTIPGSLSFYLWEATGVGFDKLLDDAIAGALRRQSDRGHKTVSYAANIFNLGGGTKN